MINSTIFRKVQLSISAFLIVIILTVFTSVSCAETLTDSLRKDSSKYLSFYETVDGETIHWEVNFDGDEIISIYKNGKRIPDDLITDYTDKVYDQLDEMRFGRKKFSFRMPYLSGKEFYFDSDELNKEMQELKKNLPKLKEKFRFYQFDSQELEKEMEELRRELEENKSNIYKFRFDENEFKEQMEKLQKYLKENLPMLKKYMFEFDIEEEDSEV